MAFTRTRKLRQYTHAEMNQKIRSSQLYSDACILSNNYNILFCQLHPR